MNAGCAGKTVRFIENACHTWAPSRWIHDEALYKSTFTFTFTSSSWLIAYPQHPHFRLLECHGKALDHGQGPAQSWMYRSPTFHHCQSTLNMGDIYQAQIYHILVLLVINFMFVVMFSCDGCKSLFPKYRHYWLCVFTLRLCLAIEINQSIKF